MALRSVADTLDTLLADVRLSEVRLRSVERAQGAVVAEDVLAPMAVPPADNSAMDGYALRLADVKPGQSLPLSQRITAGDMPQALAPGSCARIFTGAEIPAGADCVVAQEDALEADGRVSILCELKPGQHIRPCGQDIAEGQVLVSAGQRLVAADLGLLASVGIAELPVRTGLRVALLSTGDELCEPGEALPGGAIYNSNRPMLAALLEKLGCQVVDLGIIEDSAEATREALSRARRGADMVISTGGVSVGEEDHVRAQVEALGRLSLWKLAIKPGKPLAYGWLPRAGSGKSLPGADEIPFFGLPGNPVSSFVTFCLLVRPYLLAMLGSSSPLPPSWRARADFDWPRAGSRQEYLRVRVQPQQGEVWAALFPQQSSGVLSSVAWANALAIVPIGHTLQRGDWLDYLSLGDLTQ